MKRYRVLSFDMDSRSHLIKFYQDNSETIKDKTNYQNILLSLKTQFGEDNFNLKIQDLLDIGSKPHSIIAYHNKFLEQIRSSFIIGAYYPALTGACALGERILNHLLLNLRDNYKNTPEYKLVYRKNSFDNWDTLINTLTSWNILLSNASSNYKILKEKRNASIHFTSETDYKERQQAHEALILIQKIIEEQFTAFGDRPWFITDIPGEIYIKSSWESNPFIQLVYLPNSVLVGYKHEIKTIVPSIVINDEFVYGLNTLTDQEFSTKRKMLINDK
ncbi:MAG: hypothetical protein IPJ81_06380 [Chitinophagaceae bacterium]|jgi:hypothetical protein|nr:hypothetical protein [Chitinophagaceae bacterium]